MGESDRYLEYKHLRKKGFTLGNDKNAVMALFVINTVFFLLLFTIEVIFSFYEASATSFNQSVLEWFTLPSNFSSFCERPWSLVTFMFSEGSSGLWKIISNMLWLFSFGSILQKLTDNDKIIPIYIYGGWLGAFFFLVSNTFLPNTESIFLNGANPSLLAIASAATTLSPNYRLFSHIRKGIPLWIFFAIFILVDFVGIGTHSVAVIFAHVGGLFAGCIYVFLLKMGIDISRWMIAVYHKINTLFSPNKSTKSNIKEKIFYTSGNRTPFDKKTRVTQERIDALLDKINLKGYDFLTDEEKDFLKNAAEEDTL